MAGLGRRRRAIIHIGTEKAGSTTIQGVMAANRDLLQEHGFAYPASPGRQNHTRLALYAGEDRHTKGLARKEARSGEEGEIGERLPEQLAQEIAGLPAGVHTVVFSNEHCHSRLVTEASVARLKALLEPLFEEFVIVAYLRRQDDLAVSRYSTALRTGNTSGEIFPRQLDGKARFYFDYAAMLDRWGAAFGRAALRPRLFGREHFTDGDLVRDWMAVCGMGAVPLVEQEVVRNPSLLPAAQEFLLRFNREFDRRPDRRRPHWIADYLGGHFRGQGRLPRRAEAEAFHAAFAEGNERIRAEFFPARESLFGLDFGRYPEAEPPPVPEAAVLEVAMSLVAHLSGLGRASEPAAAAAAEAAPGRGGARRRAAAAPGEAAAAGGRVAAAPAGPAEAGGGGAQPARKTAVKPAGKPEADRRLVRWQVLSQALESDPADLKALRQLVRMADSPDRQSAARAYIERARTAAPGRRGLRDLPGRLGGAAAPGGGTRQRRREQQPA